MRECRQVDASRRTPHARTRANLAPAERINGAERIQRLSRMGLAAVLASFVFLASGYASDDANEIRRSCEKDESAAKPTFGEQRSEPTDRPPFPNQAEGSAKPGATEPSVETGPKAKEKPTAPSRKVFAPLGEKLVYRGILTKAGVSVDAGTATFTVTKTDDRIQLTTCAVGEKFGYSLATQVTTILNADQTAPASYHFLQKGSESREKRFEFDPGKAVYRRYKHCAEPGCEDPGHQASGKHCPDRDCRIPAHMHWKVRRNHDLEVRHFDMLSAIYFARGLELEPDGPAIEVPVLNDHDRWIVRASAKRGGRLKVKAGIFETVKIVLDPIPAPGTKPREKFRGLFGLNGTIQIWLDRKTLRPVLVRGQLPFGFMDLLAKIELIEIGKADQPCQLPASPRDKGEDVDDFGQ